MSFSTVKSAAMEGLAVEMVYVEADVSNGLPIFHMVGYLSSEVKEAAERVRSAVRNSGLEFPAKRVVINLSPATMRKRGASFDLPIAVAILTSLGVLQQNRRMKDCMIIGELGLDGQVRKVPGILSMVSEAKVQKVTSCIVPRENKKEAELVEGVRIIAVGSLRECISYLEDGDRTGGEQRYLGEKEADKIEHGGGILSEFPPGTPPLAMNFPMRNRIISGLSDAVLVMEARVRSGSLITADMALEQGKDVYALPGPLDSPLSAGCNHLIQQGAGILLNPKNLLEEWGIETNVLCRNTEIKNEKNKKVLESTDDLVYSCVGLYPKNVDQIAQESRVEIRKLMSILVTLELQGYIREITKNYYIRIK